MTNRETIKFRVWNKKNKRWLSADDGGTHACSNWVLDIFTGKIVDYVNCDGEYILSSEPDHYFDGLTHIKESPLVIQQYTGLKDKNSVEIYEGDIVNHWIDIGPGGEKQITSQIAIGEWGPNLQSWTYMEKLLPEVIGNIFENPELLEA